MMTWRIRIGPLHNNDVTAAPLPAELWAPAAAARAAAYEAARREYDESCERRAKRRAKGRADAAEDAADTADVRLRFARAASRDVAAERDAMGVGALCWWPSPSSRDSYFLVVKPPNSYVLLSG